MAMHCISDLPVTLFLLRRLWALGVKQPPLASRLFIFIVRRSSVHRDASAHQITTCMQYIQYIVYTVHIHTHKHGTVQKTTSDTVGLSTSLLCSWASASLINEVTNIPELSGQLIWKINHVYCKSKGTQCWSRFLTMTSDCWTASSSNCLWMPARGGLVLFQMFGITCAVSLLKPKFFVFIA